MYVRIGILRKLIPVTGAILLFAVCAYGILRYRTHLMEPHNFALGDPFPTNVLFLRPPTPDPALPTMVVYSASQSTPGERILRYITARSQQHLPLLPTILIAEPGLATSLHTLGLVCTGRCSLVTDAHTDIRNALKLGQQDFRVFIVNENEKVQFSAGYADPDDIRQLTEKYLAGHVTYPTQTTSDPHLLIGTELSPFPVTRVRDSASIEFLSSREVQPKHFVLFTAHCPDCSLDGFVSASASLKSPSGDPPPLLFSSKFASWQLKALLENYKLHNEAYQAVGSIPGLEDIAASTESVPADVCLITLGDSNLITNIEPLAFVNGQLEATK